MGHTKHCIVFGILMVCKNALLQLSGAVHFFNLQAVTAAGQGNDLRAKTTFRISFTGLIGWQGDQIVPLFRELQ